MRDMLGMPQDGRCSGGDVPGGETVGCGVVPLVGAGGNHSGGPSHPHHLHPAHPHNIQDHHDNGLPPPPHGCSLELDHLTEDDEHCKLRSFPTENNNCNSMPLLGGGSPGPGGEVEPGLCAGCGGKIIDRYYLLAVEKRWHASCLCCCECKLPLDSELTCFAKDGNIYCKEDYYRFALKRCARCQLGISAHELVMRARDSVYHLNCFTCASCNKMLTTGEHFGMKEDLIYCRVHYEMMMHGDFHPAHHMGPGGGPPGGHGPGGGPPGMYCGDGGPPPGQGGMPQQMPFFGGVTPVHKGRPRKRKSPGPDSDFAHMMGMGSENDMSLDGGMHMGQPPRQKRMRTSFKHHQLRIMKSYFALNHNPDAKDLKQLAQKTGLSKRVLQVWFQNARAKYRRNLLKQEQGDKGSQAGDSGGDLSSKNTSLSEHSSAHSPALSDISSSPSLSDLHDPTGMGLDGGPQPSSTALTELFSSSLNAMN